MYIHTIIYSVHILHMYIYICIISLSLYIYIYIVTGFYTLLLDFIVRLLNLQAGATFLKGK